MTEAASPQLLRLMIAKNGEALRRLLACPPSDPDSASGEQHRAQVAQVRSETETLNERLKALVENPPLARTPRRTWRDIRGHAS